MIDVDPRTFFLRDRSEFLDPGWLVRHVLLPKGRRAGHFLVGERALVALGGSCGIVRGYRGHVGEEGVIFGRRPPYEVCGVPREDVGEVVLFFAAVGDDLPVLVQLVVVILELAYLGVPLVPTGRDVGRVVAGVVVEVLADQGGSVTFLLEPSGYRTLLESLVTELFEAPYRLLVAPHVVVVGVETGEHGRS